MSSTDSQGSRAWRLGFWFARALSGFRFRIWLAILSAAALPALLVVPLQLQRVQSSLTHHAEGVLVQVAEVQQRRINAELRQMGEQANLIASRTQMRLQLNEFNLSGADSAREFITVVLEDALATVEVIDSLWIYGLGEEAVAGVGSAARQLAEPLLEHPAWREEWLLRQAYWPVKDIHCQSSIWVTTPLLLADDTIGMLVAKFSLASLIELLADFPYSDMIGSSFILMPRMAVDPGCSLRTVQLLWSVNPSEHLWDRELLNNYWDLPDGELVRQSDAEAWSSLLALPLDYGIGRLYTQSQSRLPETLRQEILGGAGLSLALVLVLALFLSIWAARSLAVPVYVLSRAVGKIRDGDEWKAINTQRWPRELVTLADVINQSAQSVARHTEALQREIGKRREAQNRYRNLANTDELTGLANRRHFIDHLSTVIAELRPDSPAVELVYLDLDRFKPINDQHGHAVGDQVLKAVAERLRNLVREADLAARLGGDEFAALVQFGEPASQPKELVQRLTTTIEQPIRLGNLTVQVGCSVGTVQLSPEMDVQTALRAADEEMYKVKISRRTAGGARQGA